MNILVRDLRFIKQKRQSRTGVKGFKIPDSR